MRVSDLYKAGNPIEGRDCYVVGLGPSMAVFPIDFLRDKFCVLLNDAQKFFPGLGPVAFANHRMFLDPLDPAITVPVVKGRLKSEPERQRLDNHVPWDHPSWYVFSYRGTSYDGREHIEESHLFAEPDFYWRGPVAVYACQLLLQARCRSITLVGCDGAPIAGEDYCTEAVEQARAATSKGAGGDGYVFHNYNSYVEGLLVMKREAEKRGVNILSLTPFVGMSDAGGQLKFMRAMRGLPPPRGKVALTERQKKALRRAEARSGRLRHMPMGKRRGK